MLIVGDVLTDADVLAFDRNALVDFGDASSLTLADKRRIAVNDWLSAALEVRGFPPTKHLVRKEPDDLRKSVAGVWSTITALGVDQAGIDASLLFLTPATDALYVGLDKPFRGLALATTDSININSVVLTVSYWGGRWTTVGTIDDRTIHDAGKSLSGSGTVTWTIPGDWEKRTCPADNGTPALFWAKLTVDVKPGANTILRQILPIVRSRLTRPAALHALALLYEEADSAQRGKWAEKADRYFKAADVALESAVGMVGDEFDMDASESVSEAEVNSLAKTIRARPPYTWERG